MDPRVLLKSNFFLFYLRDIVEDFLESDETFWRNFVFVNFKREFECHGVKYGGFETMHFRKL